MKYLMMDTSTATMYLLLQDEQQTIDMIVREGNKDHQAYIIPLIDELLKRNQLQLADVDGFVVGVGPGSYTGLRVSVMTAKMLGVSLKKPVYKISSLLFLTSGYEKPLYAWHDARNHNGFSALIEKGQFLNEEAFRNLDDLSDAEKEKLVYLNHETILIDGKVIRDHMVLVDNVYDLIPHYLRKTEAEYKLDQRRK